LYKLKNKPIQTAPTLDLNENHTHILSEFNYKIMLFKMETFTALNHQHDHNEISLLNAPKHKNLQYLGLVHVSRPELFWRCKIDFDMFRCHQLKLILPPPGLILT